MGVTYNKIIFIQIAFKFICIMGITNADWVEIPQSKPFSETSSKISGTTFFSDIKTPVHIVYNADQIENLESSNYSSTIINKRVTPEEVSQLETNIPKKNRITIKPAKSYIMEVFSSTTQFTPLMSSISDSTNIFTTESSITTRSTTTAAPVKPTVLAKTTTTSSPRKPAKIKTVVGTTKPSLRQTPSNNNRNKTKVNAKLRNHSDGIEIEDAPNDDKDEKLENREIPDIGSFSSYAGFLPFLKSIQTTLMQRAHKSIKSKIQVLKDLRDNLLYEIDQRIQKLWYRKETASEARGYKEDYHMDFPSNEAALMTIGFLTLAVFLVKLVLKVIAAVKAKKSYYTTTTTTTMATMTGRKKRSVDEYDELDIDSTYRILSSIDNFSLKYGNN